MSKDKAEEKAREYAELRYCQHCRLKYNCNYKNSCNDYNDSIEIFESGYTQAVTDLSTDNAQLREALRELVELAPVVIDPSVAETYFEALEFRRKFILASEKAKQLLTDKE